MPVPFPTMYVLDISGMTKAFAHDSTRQASASIESILSITQLSNLPKSSGWIMVQAYYSAFFAAHSLLRMAGRGCYRLEPSQVAAINHVGAGSNSPAIGAGMYDLKYNALTREMAFTKISAKMGSHQALWECFLKLIREISTALLSVSSGFNPTSVLLIEIDNLLAQPGHTNGGWLSFVRNQVNYHQALGAWYPYQDAQHSTRDLMRIIAAWASNPDLMKHPSGDCTVMSFVRLCVTIVSLCNAAVEDMERGMSDRRYRSFHRYGSLAVIQLASA